MKIRSPEQLDGLLDVIGEQNIEGCRKALKDQVMIWVFQGVNEVEAESELTEKEKKFCLSRFAGGETWAGIFRSSPRPCTMDEVLLGLSPEHNAHGDRIDRGGGSSHDSIH